MASRQNLSGRPSGKKGMFYDAINAYKEQEEAANVKRLGPSRPGESMGSRMSKLKASNARRNAKAAGEPVDQGRRGVFGSLLKKRGGIMQQMAARMKQAQAPLVAPPAGAEVTQGAMGAPLMAKTPAVSPAGEQESLGGWGGARRSPGSKGSATRGSKGPLAKILKGGTGLLNRMPGLPAPAASMGQPTPMVPPSTSVETMGGPAPGAVAPAASGGRSIRSRGLHRSRRAPEDRG